MEESNVVEWKTERFWLMAAGRLKGYWNERQNGCGLWLPEDKKSRSNYVFFYITGTNVNRFI